MKNTLFSNNCAKIKIDNQVYPLEAIYKACFVFIDQAYIWLDKQKDGKLIVLLEGKTKKLSLKKLEGEFLNELLNSSLRLAITKRNKKLTEQMIAGAISSALRYESRQEASREIRTDERETEEEIRKLRAELALIEAEGDYREDALEIRKLQPVKPANKQKHGKK